MFRAILILLAGVSIAYLGLCAALFIVQRSLIYFPQPASNQEDSKRLSLSPPGARIFVSVREMNGPRAVIYFGGNAEDVSASLPFLSEAFPGSAVYLLHYRSYGGSSGRPSEKALFADALMLFDRVRSDHSQIEIVGRSLGSAIAVYVASVRPVGRLVLVTPFDSLEGVAALYFRYLPVRWLLRDKYESWRYAPQVTAPTLIIAAEHDEIVPRASTELLQSRFRKGLVSYKIIAGVGHNTVSDRPEYFDLLTGEP